MTIWRTLRGAGEMRRVNAVGGETWWKTGQCGGWIMNERVGSVRCNVWPGALFGVEAPALVRVVLRHHRAHAVIAEDPVRRLHRHFPRHRAKRYGAAAHEFDEGSLGRTF